MKPGQSFSVIPGWYAICRLSAKAPLPSWAGKAFTSITRTADELSIVCDEQRLPPNLDGLDLRIERGWALVKILGPFPLDVVGVLASVAKPLADAKISLFALSTFDTDYILVKRTHVNEAIAALTLAGHRLVED